MYMPLHNITRKLVCVYILLLILCSHVKCVQKEYFFAVNSLIVSTAPLPLSGSYTVKVTVSMTFTL